MKKLDFPELPIFNENTITSCRVNKDFRPIFFEIYKHVGLVCNLISCINKKSSVLRDISNVKYGLLIGLINRCSRLMLANTVISCEGKFGETTTILDRCIQESAINVRWLCKFSEDNSFERYIIAGLKSDIELEKNIKKKIADRDGNVLVIEKRMLESIERCIILTGINRENFGKYPKLPNLEIRMKNLDFINDDLLYTVNQRLGSNYIHGTWTSLITQYLEENDGVFHPKDNIVSIHVNQFVSISLFVLTMLKEFLIFISANESITQYYLLKLDDIRSLIDEYRYEIIGNDYNEI